jgi:hypothetical protein
MHNPHARYEQVLTTAKIMWFTLPRARLGLRSERPRLRALVLHPGHRRSPATGIEPPRWLAPHASSLMGISVRTGNPAPFLVVDRRGLRKPIPATTWQQPAKSQSFLSPMTTEPLRAQGIDPDEVAYYEKLAHR